MKKYKEVREGIRSETQAINGDKEFEYDKDFMKTKLDSDDDLPLNKQLKVPTKTIIVRSVFEDIDKFIYMSICMRYKNATQYKANKY